MMKLFLLSCVSLQQAVQAKLSMMQATAQEMTALSDRWLATRRASVQSPCPCANPALCLPITGPPTREKEIFGFLGGQDPTALNWTLITTVAWATSDAMLCAAHENNARAVLASPSVLLTANVTAQLEWAENALTMVQERFADGLVFDNESPLPVGSPDAEWYAQLIRTTRDVFHQANPSLQISTCTAWSPDDIDGRGYPMTQLADASDLLYVMDYDTRSQVFDACIASANAPTPGMLRGLQRYFDAGVASSKLVLGQPWYGYRYPCVPGMKSEDRFCGINLVPFRGVNCSDAAGGEIAFSSILEVQQQPGAGKVKWESYMESSYFNLLNSTSGEVEQFWFDDARSLRSKYGWARKMGLLGVGPFTFNDAYAPMFPTESSSMWQALEEFLK